MLTLTRTGHRMLATAAGNQLPVTVTLTSSSTAAGGATSASGAGSLTGTSRIVLVAY
jgi:hypothetical protein